jgi:uncharacterized protein DUF4843
MKRVSIFLFTVSFVLILTACIKNDEPIYTASVVELDAATWNANSVGVTYPILTLKPAHGRATNASNSVFGDTLMTRRSGTIQLRVNLVGTQQPGPLEITYEVVAASTTAVAGTHYTLLPGKLTIPAKSSFGYIDVPILNPGATSGTVDLVIRLTGGTGVTISPNYNTVGLRISQS